MGVDAREHALDLLLGAAATGQPLGARFMALTYLGKIPDPRALDGLEGLTANTEDRNLRTAALNALAASGDGARASAAALRLVSDPDPSFAVAAVRAAARVGGAEARARFQEALPHESRVFVRLAIQRAVGS
jgi:HEAT repeat protein